MSTELEVSIKKKVNSFWKDYNCFFNHLVKEKENSISIQREHSIPFKQLLVKEILVNGP